MKAAKISLVAILMVGLGAQPAPTLNDRIAVLEGQVLALNQQMVDLQGLAIVSIRLAMGVEVSALDDGIEDWVADIVSRGEK